jgi:hypothetical protein
MSSTIYINAVSLQLQFSYPDFLLYISKCTDKCLEISVTFNLMLHAERVTRYS